MPFTYILQCSDCTYYTGSTWDLERRVSEYAIGTGANYTANRLPVKLVHCEEFDRIDAAFRREKQIQNWSHQKKKALISGDFSLLKDLSKKRF
ncbi:MAG: GIY-YIG nuclease family protein [Spirochaetia bacterium]|nr:GIY-YIG nuclease family protein [Spirochaetia bacterium]